MSFELYAEEYEAGLGLALEDAFGTFKAPSVWVPGTCELEYEDGLRVLELPVNEAEATHVSQHGIGVAGAVNLHVCPGQEAILVGSSTPAGILQRNSIRPSSFSVAKVIGDGETMAYYGVKVNTWTLTSQREADLMCNMDCIGVNEAQWAPATPAYANLAAPYILEEMTLVLNGQQRIEFDSIEIKGDHRLRDDIYGNQHTRQDITSQGRSIEISLEGWRGSNQSLRAAHRANQTVSLQVRWTRGSHYLDLQIPVARITKCDPTQTREPIELSAMKVAGSATQALVWSYA